MKSAINKKTLFLLAQNIIVVTILFLLVQIPIFKEINNFMLDQLQGQTSTRPEIVVVGIDDDSLQKIGAVPWDRSVYAKALTNILAQKPNVIGIDVLFPESRSGDDQVQNVINNSQVPIVFGSKIVDSDLIKSVYQNSLSGFVNFDQDADGKIRKTKVFSLNNGVCELSLASELIRNYLKISDKNNLCESTIKLRNDSFQLDSNNQLSFAYVKEHFTTIPFYKAWNNELDADVFKNKIVLIGSTTLDLRLDLNDNFEDIFGQNIAGVNIHANVVNSFLNNSFYYPVNEAEIFVLMLVLTTILTFVLMKLDNNLINFIIVIIILIIVNVAGIALFEFNLQWSFATTNILILGSYIFVIAYKFLTKKNEAQFLKKAFEQYMNPKLLGELIKNPSILQLGGQTKRMTVLFSDIRSFTSISEKLTPEELVHMINDYLNFMSEIIINNEGTIDKYIGDAIMALWNAPLDDVDHETNAVRTSLEMQESVKKFNETHTQYPPIKIGVGLNTGDMVVGNVGGARRFDYTVLGDNVNLGSRLEGLTKKYGVGIIVSEEVKRGVKDKNIIFRFLDEMKVKGKDTAVKIFEPMRSSDENAEKVKKYEEAFVFYQRGNFKKAKELLEKLTEDEAAHKLLERIETLGEAPDDWHGIWKWEEK